MVRKTITTEIRGGKYGGSYDDKTFLKDLETSILERIVLTHGDYVYSLAVSTIPSSRGTVPNRLMGIDVLQ